MMILFVILNILHKYIILELLYYNVCLMNINVLVASTINGGIGYMNKLPWHFKSDLKKFRKLTYQPNLNNVVIMGKNTWHSLPNKPLPNRLNIVLSTTMTQNQVEPNNKNIIVCNDMKKAFEICNTLKDANVSIIGGSKVYSEFDKLHLSDTEKYKHYLYYTVIGYPYVCDIFYKCNIYKYDLIDIEREILRDELNKDLDDIQVLFCQYSSR